MEQLSEREKCARGMLYDANYDAELTALRRECQSLCHELNLLSPSREEERRALLRRIIGGLKGAFEIVSPFFCDYGSQISAGDNLFINTGCVILDEAPVTFGNNVFVAPNCAFYTASHPLDASLRNRGLETAKPIRVGNDVWIGGNVVVLPGVSIGDGAVIGAGSVVTRDVPPKVVAAGNPCRVLKTID